MLADPHTLVLDEATSLLDPRAARHLERSLASVLTGRTVVAIAHRLHTAHDADRVAVVEDGLLQELGTHDELIENDGAYAALWESWQYEREQLSALPGEASASPRLRGPTASRAPASSSAAPSRSPPLPELERRSEHAARAGKQQRAGEQGLGALGRDAERARRLRGRTAGEDLDGPLEIVRVEAAADDLRQRAGAAADRERERRPSAGSCPRARGRRHPTAARI